MSFLSELKILKLQGNKIDQDGIQLLYGLIRRHRQIISIDLRDNPGLTEEHSAKILKELKQNYSC